MISYPHGHEQPSHSFPVFTCMSKIRYNEFILFENLYVSREKDGGWIGCLCLRAVEGGDCKLREGGMLGATS